MKANIDTFRIIRYLKLFQMQLSELAKDINCKEIVLSNEFISAYELAEKIRNAMTDNIDDSRLLAQKLEDLTNILNNCIMHFQELDSFRQRIENTQEGLANIEEVASLIEKNNEKDIWKIVDRKIQHTYKMQKEREVYNQFQSEL